MPAHPSTRMIVTATAAVLILVIALGSLALFFRMRSIIAEQQAAESTAGSRAAQRDDPTYAANLRIGDTMPDFSFRDHDGNERRLSEFLDGTHFVVVNFTHPDCPCARSCSELIGEMEKEGYEDVRVIGFLPSGFDDPRVLTALEEQREEGVLTYPVFHDRGQELVRLLGATRTPEMWILDRQGRVRFWGAPENTLVPGSEGHRYLLREAIDALRADRDPEITSYRPIGCAIEKI